MGCEKDADLIIVMEAFDRLDGAASRVLTALPAQMTEAAANLEQARIGMRSALQSFGIASARKATRAALKGGE